MSEVTKNKFTLKWGETPFAIDRFVAVSNLLVDYAAELGISRQHAWLLVTIMRSKYDDRKTFPSQVRLGVLNGVTRGQIGLDLAELDRQGFIRRVTTRKAGGAFANTEYDLTPLVHAVNTLHYQNHPTARPTDWVDWVAPGDHAANMRHGEPAARRGCSTNKTLDSKKTKKNQKSEALNVSSDQPRAKLAPSAVSKPPSPVLVSGFAAGNERLSQSGRQTTIQMMVTQARTLTGDIHSDNGFAKLAARCIDAPDINQGLAAWDAGMRAFEKATGKKQSIEKPGAYFTEVVNRYLDESGIGRSHTKESLDIRELIGRSLDALAEVDHDDGAALGNSGASWTENLECDYIDAFADEEDFGDE
ncbi:MAG TPA: hypothetical protein VGK19_18305 [Capsulimonadaceae bacterium]